MAYEIPQFSITLLTGSTFVSKQYYACKLDTSGYAIPCDASGEAAIGVMQDAPAAARPGIVMKDGVTKIVLGDTITAGDAITVDVNGAAKTVVTTDKVLGRALASGVAGDQRSILLFCQQ